MPDKFVLQNDITGTIHQLVQGRQTYCGVGKNSKTYKRRRLSKALEHPKAHHCKMPGKCVAHQ